MFDGLGMQGKPDGYSVSNIFEGSFNEYVTVEEILYLKEG